MTLATYDLFEVNDGNYSLVANFALESEALEYARDLTEWEIVEQIVHLT